MIDWAAAAGAVRTLAGMTSRITAVCAGVAVVLAMPAPAPTAPASAWSIVPSPNPSLSANRLRGLAAPAPGAVWSVGSRWDDTTGRDRTLIQRWDGTTWRTVDSPGTPTGHDTLTAVAGASATNLWAVGFSTASPDDPGGTDDPGRSVALMLHGDGSSWSAAVPEVPGTSARLAAVDMLDARDGWAVGSYVTPGDSVTRGLILRWTGGAWRPVPSPDTDSAPVRLTGVSARGADDVWAVGYAGRLGGPARAIALHFDGRDWRQPALDLDRAQQSALFGVADGWAVGYTWAAGRRRALALRWTGQDWQRVPVAVSDEDTQLRGVAVLSGGVWAVGYSVDRGVDTALLTSFDGAAFVEEAPPTPPADTGNIAGTAVTAIAASPDTGEVWAVGCLAHNTRVLRREAGVR